MKRTLTSIWTIFGILLSANTLLMFVSSSNGGEAGALYSLSCRMFMFLIYGMYFLQIIRTGKTRGSRELVLFFAMIASALISYLANPIGSITSWAIIVLSYLEIPVLTLVIQNGSNSNSIMKSNVFKSILLLNAVFLIYRAFVNPIYDVYSGALTMGYSNSNRTAIYILMIFAICISIAKKEKKHMWKMIYIAVSVILTAILPITQSRSAAACAAAIWLFVVFDKKIKSIINKRWIMILVLMPLIFTAIYMYLVENRVSWFVEAMVYGKSLDSGREFIYRNCFEALRGNWLLGNYAFSPLENKHNTLLSVMTSFGVVGLVCFIAFYYYLFKNYYTKASGKKGDIFVLLCMLVIYMTGMTEAAVFTSGIMYAGMFGMLMLIENTDSSFARGEMK